MVTSTKYPGLEVAVHVDDEPLREYDDGDEDPPLNTVTRYVEAKSGAEFAVITIFKPPFSPPHGVMISLIVDGSPVTSRCCRQDELFDRVFKMHAVHRKIHGEWVMQKLRFSELDIVEEAPGLAANVTDVRNALSSKGKITLLLHFVKNIREIGSDVYWERNVELTPLDEIPGEALKENALSHQAALTAPERSQSRSGQKLRVYSLAEKEPFATFHFKYRSLASLEALGVVPRDDSMTVALEERPEEDLTPDELRELVRRMRQREAQSNLIKRETADKGPIKHEEIADDEEATAARSRTHKRPRADPEVTTID
ncbi:hypothetical protein COCMIDRAFT_4134 [Bipolaris oryzae ATCC 44560]|uniref:DUF7918 domain-containing protein n=1 Tax=Bipolaris oryzae ATCC 44560 TaxID=930090 RepID=W6ZA59_COCMI|nr:uncharacterized protein COCMIDRAFT_4134 [Bipolaris oryzae ATCC 44560]EUC46850.1 hypothetical protein COCMIDRAFT_4134 [Bipolaris oryzae ATCC 44560]